MKWNYEKKIVTHSSEMMKKLPRRCHWSVESAQQLLNGNTKINDETTQKFDTGINFCVNGNFTLEKSERDGHE